MNMNYPIDPKRTAVLVIDMQNAFHDSNAPFHNKEVQDVAGKISQLISVAREKELEIIFIRHVVRSNGAFSRLTDKLPRSAQILKDGSWEAEVIDDLKPADTDIVVDKPHFGAFTGTDLDGILRSKGIDTLIICGTVTNVCCDTTARQAVEKQYKVIFIGDATAANDKPDLGWGPVSAEEFKRVTLTTLASVFCQVSSLNDVIEEIKAL